MRPEKNAAAAFASLLTSDGHLLTLRLKSGETMISLF
jgi:hypothetical protein